MVDELFALVSALIDAIGTVSINTAVSGDNASLKYALLLALSHSIRLYDASRIAFDFDRSHIRHII